MTDLVEYNKQYHPYLSEFMAFLHPDAMFDTNSVIGIDLLAEVKPNDVARFLRLKAFGTADPTPDMQPHCGRANSLGQYKKAISYYVRVIKSEAWNERIQDGNPTRSAIVNDVIKRVKRQRATNNFLFGSSDKPKRTKEFMYNVLRKLWDSDGFVPEAMGPLGTHSLRKFPATYARRNGCTKMTLMPVGVGGEREIHRSVSLVLARPILWACFDARMESAMPVELRTRIREAYAGIRVLEADVNPVDRVLLVVTGYENQVHIDEIVGEELGEEDANGTHIVGGTRGGMVNAQHFRALYAQNVALRREVQELRDSLEVFRNSTRDFMHRMNSNITRIGIQPARVRRPDAGGAAVVEEEQQNRDNVGGMDRTATLSRTPRDLHILWHEYEFGLGGRKPARLFTPAERGRCKYLYHRRKVVWDQIASMIRAGHTAQSAIDYLYYQYGRDKPVTQIINDMRRHRMRDRNNLGYHV
ncbi:hypothetical protein MHU86_20795 [Fragilaria crotonensis]|nr:hypothetical protein MHU86_20795 [Fragilaria crotonensis]